MAQKVEYGTDDCMNSNGSSLRGYQTTTYDNLVDLFGEPNAYSGDKTWNAWDLCFTVHDDDGEDSEDVYVSIYDWKESSPDHSRIGEYRWHIGGFAKGEHRADWLVSDLLLGKDGWPAISARGHGMSPYTFVRR